MLRAFGLNVNTVLLYGSETWRLTKGLEQKLQVFINKSLRNILRIWWPRKISNKKLWIQAEQRPIGEEIRQRAWGWIGNPNTSGDAREWQSWRRNMLREMRQKVLHNIGLGGAR